MRKFTHQSRIIRSAMLGTKLSQMDVNYMIFGHRRQGQIISNWCRGRQGVPAKHIAKVCQVLEIEKSEMIEAKLRDEREFLDKISYL